jgi:sigma-E factor negative regulatory protein RseB
VRRRVLLAAAGAVAGLGLLVVAALAALGSTDMTTGSADWSGWTGRVDTASMADRAAMTPDDAVAVALLARSARAASTIAYVGRAVSWNSSGTVTTDLTHLPGRGTIARRAGAPASQATFAAEGRSGSFADDGRPLALLRDNYRVLREADLDQRVAGRPADAVVAVSADGVLEARYWIDRATGLLLRKELLDAKGLVRQRTAFDTIRIGVPSGTQIPEEAADAWSRQLDATGLATARRAGCACPDSLPGGLQLLDTSEAPAGAVSTTPVVHQLFSDGLTTVSLFSLTGDISADDAAGLTARGFALEQLAGYRAWVRGGSAASPTATVVWACRGSVLTLVTDDSGDPIGTASAVVAALPPTPDSSEGSLLARIARGWDRITGSGS